MVTDPHLVGEVLKDPELFPKSKFLDVFVNQVRFRGFPNAILCRSSCLLRGVSNLNCHPARTSIEMLMTQNKLGICRDFVPNYLIAHRHFCQPCKNAFIDFFSACLWVSQCLHLWRILQLIQGTCDGFVFVTSYWVC